MPKGAQTEEAITNVKHCQSWYLSVMVSVTMTMWENVTEKDKISYFERM